MHKNNYDNNTLWSLYYYQSIGCNANHKSFITVLCKLLS